jgi:sensor histidine kinase YesM
MTRRPVWLLPLVIVTMWTLLAFFNTAQRYIGAGYLGDHPAFAEAVSYPLQQALIWALLTPVLLIAVSRSRALWQLFAVTLVIAVVKIVIDYVTFPLFNFISVEESGFALFRRMFFNRIIVSFLTSAIIAGLSFAVTNYERYRDRELRARELEARLAQSQLQVLEMQLNPHFLFNALQSIAELMHSDVDAADRMIGRLSDLLRVSLSRFGVHELALRDEIDFLRKYLAIEEIRFSDRMRVEFDVGADVLDAAVPNLILQPLVENAVKHGVARRLEPSRVRIAAHRSNSSLLLEVSDDGPGVSTAQGERVGLANTRARLDQLFGADHRFVLDRAPSGGMRVELSIPFRELGHEA